MTVAVFGIVRIAPDKLKGLLPALKALVEITNKHDGCIAYDVGEDPFEPGLLRFSELWPDQAALDAHIKAPHIPAWREALKSVEVLERKFVVYDASNKRSL